GNAELIYIEGGSFGYAEPNRRDPEAPWHFRVVTPDLGYQRFTHGLGIGDVNNDGRIDILEKNGWWEHPIDEAELWEFHPVAFSEPGGSQMYAYDFDGDGDNDVLTAKAAHGYGLAWFENKGGSSEIEFEEHLILGERADQNEHGVVFSQLHAIALVDMDNDGILDVLTGKRFWAHRGLDVGGRDTPVLYWFGVKRDGGKVRFEPHLIDDDSGVGTQIEAVDLNGDERLDVVVGNKRGGFLFLQNAGDVQDSPADASAK
ncbi:MAG: VCBS repeat-containing protein, partial [Planctomycetales bacterium]|nr:VCBS repeat-containing protein [Planctomycetales bacterium]